MRKKLLIINTFFFLFILVCSMTISTATTLLHHYEYFDDDTVGQLPTNSWSVCAGSKVSNADFESAPNSVYSSSYLSIYSSFEINFPCTTNETRLEVQFDAKASANAWGFAMEGKNGIFAQARLQANQGNGTFNISFGNGTTWIYPTRYFNYSEWLECDVEMDFVHQDYIFKIEDDCNGNKFYSDDYANDANFMSGADNIEKFYITTYYAYVDDLFYLAPDEHPTATLNSPANNSHDFHFLCPPGGELNVTVLNDNINPIDVTFYLFRYYVGFGVEWIEVANHTVSGCSSGDYVTWTIPDSPEFMPNGFYAWFVNVSDGSDYQYCPNGTGLSWGGWGTRTGNGLLSDYAWTFWTENLTQPFVTVNYPTGDVTTAQWRANPVVNFTIDGYTLNCSGTYYGFGYNYCVYLADKTELLAEIGDLLFDSGNSYLGVNTFEINLSDYVAFNDLDYTIGIYAFFAWTLPDGIVPWMTPGYANHTEQVFQILTGSSPFDKPMDMHFAVKNCRPANGDLHAFEYVGQSFYFDACSNYSKNFPNAWIFLTVSDSNLYHGNTMVFSYGKRELRYGIMGLTGSILNSKVFNTYPTTKSLLLPKFRYRVYIGFVVKTGATPGTFWNNGQVDLLYDDSCVYVPDRKSVV